MTINNLTITNNFPEELLIYDRLLEQTGKNMTHGAIGLTDITFLGLEQSDWDIYRGMRQFRNYYYDNDEIRTVVDEDGVESTYELKTDTVAIQDHYEYTLSADGKSITDLTRYIEWYDFKGNIGLTKTISENLTAKKLKSINRAIRQNRIDYLESAGEEAAIAANSVPEPYASYYTQVAAGVETLLLHYKNEVDDYINHNFMDFENAVNNETDASIIAILDLVARQPDTEYPNGLTVKQSIIHQLTGVKP